MFLFIIWHINHTQVCIGSHTQYKHSRALTSTFNTHWKAGNNCEYMYFLFERVFMCTVSICEYMCTVSMCKYHVCVFYKCVCAYIACVLWFVCIWLCLCACVYIVCVCMYARARECLYCVCIVYAITFTDVRVLCVN